MFDQEALLTCPPESGDEQHQPPAPARNRRRRLAAVGLAALCGAGVAARRWGLPAPMGGGVGSVQSDAMMPCTGDPCKPNMDFADTLLSHTCSGAGENCSASRCCRGEGLQCYVKDAAWAECRRSCAPGPDPTGADSGPWNCTALGHRAPGQAPACAQAGEDCAAAGCCATPGLQCYEKGPGWATCKVECTPGVDLTDSDDHPWSCKPLGPRAPGPAAWVAKECAAPGESCLQKECCALPGQQCYAKNEWWGECAVSCSSPSLCIERGQRTPQLPVGAPSASAPLAAWVAEKCAASGEQCASSRCCRDPGNHCFQKNASFAVCRGECMPGVDLYDSDPTKWWCHPLGPRTPGTSVSEPWKAGKPVADWVAEVCAPAASHDCRPSGCCADAGHQCYEKNAGWAACLPSCKPGAQAKDKNGGDWSCKELGPRTRAAWGTPSLYCFSVVQPTSYEPGLMTAQQGTGAGIFACDEYSIFSTERFTIGAVETITFIPAPVVTSKDNTAGNTELFMHVWDSVKQAGLWQATDWTIKVDPDAVLLPQRLRRHLEPHTGQKVYMVNCAKPYMPEGPMMFGAMEAISSAAIAEYFAKVGDCAGGLPWKAWGEDLFMGKCLEKIGVQRANDFRIYSDGVCTGVDCTDPDAAAFHPKKDVASWLACLEETKHPVARPTTDAPQWFKDYMASYTS